MKKVYIIAIALLIGFQANPACALSLEARTVVEQLRNKLYQTIIISDNAEEIVPDNEKYVPGEELAKALARFRSGIYKTSRSEPDNFKSLESRVEELSQIVNTSSDSDLYVPGAMLKKSLERVKKSRNLNTRIAPDKISETVSVVGSLKNGSVVSKNEKNEPVKIARSHKKNRRNTKRIDVKSEKLLELEDKRVNDAGIPVVVKPIPSKQQKQDKEVIELNEQIKRHEFKMPSNYRIIVR